MRLTGGDSEVEMGFLWISSRTTVLCFKRKLAAIYDIPVVDQCVVVNKQIVSDQDLLSSFAKDRTLSVNVWFVIHGRGGTKTSTCDENNDDILKAVPHYDESHTELTCDCIPCRALPACNIACLPVGRR